MSGLVVHKVAVLGYAHVAMTSVYTTFLRWIADRKPHVDGDDECRKSCARSIYGFCNRASFSISHFLTRNPNIQRIHIRFQLLPLPKHFQRNPSFNKRIRIAMEGSEISYSGSQTSGSKTSASPNATGTVLTRDSSVAAESQGPADSYQIWNCRLALHMSLQIITIIL